MQARNRTAPLRTMAAALVATALLALPARACPVCIDLPQNTVADHVLGDVITVLARPRPGDPFRYDVAEVLRGNPADLDWLPEIPFLISTPMRRAFQADPGLAVLLTYGAPRADAEDPVSGDTWHKHLTVTPDRRPVIEAMIAEGDDWYWGTTSDPARFGFFAALLESSDRRLQSLALAEISRAPYAGIRTLGDRIAPSELRLRLTDRNELRFAPLFILLLGASSDPAARALVRERFDLALRTGSPQIDAWTVAGLEVDRGAAIGPVKAALKDPRRSLADRIDLLVAMTVAGSAIEELRPGLSQVMRELAHTHPEHLADVAYAFYDWRDWSLNPHFETLLAGDEIDHATRYILEIMVATGRTALAEATE